jgi:hypothetical protein
MTPSWLITALVGLALGSAGGWQVHAWKAGADERDRLEKTAQAGRDDAKRMDRAAEKFETAQSQAQRREAHVIQEVIRVIEKPVYRERCLDDDGLRLLADDIDASNARRGLAAAVPTARPTDGRDEAGDVAMESPGDPGL